jgi:adenylate cyclase
MPEPDIHIPADKIYIQVEKICSSSELNTKQLLCRLLRYLVKEKLEGRGEKLKGYTIGVELCKRGDSFDTVQDPVVRIHAGRLRRMLKMYYLETGKQDPVRIEIPKGNYIPVFVANSYSVDKQGTVSHEHKTQPFEPLIAIVPFKNLSGDPEKDYFALGFSEELSVELSKYEDLTIINATHISILEHSEHDKMEYLRNLGVLFMVDGSVSINNNQVRILVKLTEVANNRQIWAERYIRNTSITNLINIQENIAGEIASELASEYGIILQRLAAESNRIKPKVLDTYHAVLKYYYFEAHHTHEAAMEAMKALEEAISIDPGSGIANAMLASMYGTQYMLDLSNAKEAYEKMGMLAEKAIKLDPNNTTVRVILCYKCFVYNQKERFFREVDNCLSMQPKSCLRLGSIGFHLSLFGDWERGKSILDKVRKMKICFPKFFYGATMLYYYRLGEFETALEEANQYDMPTLFWGPMLQAAVLGQLKRIDEAKQNTDHLKQMRPDFEMNARYLISRYVKEENLVEQVIAGLRKAGLEIPHSTSG